MPCSRLPLQSLMIAEAGMKRASERSRRQLALERKLEIASPPPRVTINHNYRFRFWLSQKGSSRFETNEPDLTQLDAQSDGDFISAAASGQP